MSRKAHSETDWTLPEGLRFGALLSAHEVEGSDFESDWWHWEQRPGHILDGSTSEPAADYWNRYHEDIALARKLGLQVVVRALSWARIMTGPEASDTGALGRYADEMQQWRAAGIEPVVSLWHVALPAWFSEVGGWRNTGAPLWFETYARTVSEALREQVTTWLPLLDPMHGLQQAAWRHRWPGNLSPWHVRRVERHLLEAHRRATHVLKETAGQAVRIGASVVTQQFVPEDDESVWDLRFARHNEDRYTHHYVRSLPEQPDFLLVSDGGRQGLRLAPLAWRNAFSLPVGNCTPLGIVETLRPFAGTGMPLWYGGCLVPHEDDHARRRRLYEDFRALAEDEPRCAAYVHRSFLDGFAWDRGHHERFGLVHVARDDLARTPNDSAFFLREVAQQGALRAGAVARFVPVREEEQG